MRDPLSVYLQDHLAGAMFGVELVERSARNNEGTEFSAGLRQLSDEIRSDRETLMRLMRDLGVKPSTLKTSVAWASEKIQRLKVNGRLAGYSPLARLEELESLVVGIAGKRALWSSFERVGRPLEGYDFAALREAAEDQLARVEALRLKAAVEALGSTDAR